MSSNEKTFEIVINDKNIKKIIKIVNEMIDKT